MMSKQEKEKAMDVSLPCCWYSREDERRESCQLETVEIIHGRFVQWDRDALRRPSDTVRYVGCTHQRHESHDLDLPMVWILLYPGEYNRYYSWTEREVAWKKSHESAHFWEWPFPFFAYCTGSFRPKLPRTNCPIATVTTVASSLLARLLVVDWLSHLFQKLHSGILVQWAHSTWCGGMSILQIKWLKVNGWRMISKKNMSILYSELKLPLQATLFFRADAVSIGTFQWVDWSPIIRIISLRSNGDDSSNRTTDLNLGIKSSYQLA